MSEIKTERCPSPCLPVRLERDGGLSVIVEAVVGSTMVSSAYADWWKDKAWNLAELITIFWDAQAKRQYGRMQEAMDKIIDIKAAFNRTIE